MSSITPSDLVRRINSTGSPKGVVYVAGGGTELFPMLLGGGGGSATLLSGRIPYSTDDFRAVLGSDPGQFVDDRAARGLAMSAFRHALTIRGDLSTDQVFGLGSTSKLSRGSDERPGRSHEIHAALQTETATIAWSVVLPDASDRVREERVNALLLLNLLARAKGIDGSVAMEAGDLEIAPDSVTIRESDSSSCRNSGLPGLLNGRNPWVAYDLPAVEEASPTETPKLVLPGSFRPLHGGHLAMAEVASRIVGTPCGFEISLFHPEKPPLDFVAIRSRLEGFGRTSGRLYLTHAPTYVEKARLFPGCTFVVGHDTAVRILDPRFYGGKSGRDAMLEELESLGTRFLIFGRVDGEGQFRDFTEEQFEHPVAGFLARVASTVPAEVFRVDVSSTEVRRTSLDDHS